LKSNHKPERKVAKEWEKSVPNIVLMYVVSLLSKINSRKAPTGGTMDLLKIYSQEVGAQT
jgi:hypothetical protein